MKRPIITLEDGTEVLETTGDIDALSYGGGVLYRTPDRRCLFWSFWSPKDLGAKLYEVFTAPIPADVIEFFDPDLKELSAVTGIEIKTIKKLGKSKNPTERLQVVIDIRECFGASRVDPNHEPKLMTVHDIAKAWGPALGISESDVPKLDYEDFIIREIDGYYECGSIDGKYLGKFKKYKHALCAIAECMHEFKRSEGNVFHEHSFNNLEIVDWDMLKFIGKINSNRSNLLNVKWRADMRRYIKNEILDKKDIDPKRKIFSEVKKAKASLSQKDRIKRAKAIGKSMREIYG